MAIKFKRKLCNSSHCAQVFNCSRCFFYRFDRAFGFIERKKLVVEFLKKHDNEFTAFDVLVHDYVDFLRYYAYCGSSSGNWFMCVVKYVNDDKIELEHVIHQDVLEFVSDKLVSLKNVL